MDYIATFFTHIGAIKYYRFLSSLGITAETMPVPRKYSSNCGVCVKFSTSQDVISLVSEDMEKLFLVKDGNDKLILDNS